MTYLEKQANSNHCNNMSNQEDFNTSSGTVIPLETRNVCTGQRRVSFSSTTKKLVFPTRIILDDDDVQYDKENYVQNCYDQDIMKPIDVFHDEKENSFKNEDAINEIGEYEDCSDEDDEDDDDYELGSPLQDNVHSLTPIPVNHRPAVYPHQYHAARYGIYPQNLQQSQSYNGFYYSPPPIYPYPSAMSQLQYVPISSPPVADEQPSKQTISKPTEKNDTTGSTSTTQGTGRPRGGVSEPFPDKLYRMIETCEQEGKTDVVSFSVHGTTFAIHKPKRFTSEVMTRFFKQSKLTSFQRQLNLYGFKRISTGPDIGAYWVRIDLTIFGIIFAGSFSNILWFLILC
jgi:HSF-type DNA-binding